MTGNAHRVVIVGGGFGGLYAARSLARSAVAVTLLDRRNFHLFQPLLYQVATGALSPANIAAPLRSILRKQKNTTVLMAEVTGVDTDTRRVFLDDGSAVPYDTLIVAAGARHHYFGHPEWEALAPGLKTVEDATEIRHRILVSFEAAERAGESSAERAAFLTFVVIGGGPTGAELAGALGEIARYTLRREFRRIDPGEARILLIEAGPRILAAFREEASRSAARQLESLGVTIETGAVVTGVTADAVTYVKAGVEHVVKTRVALWAAGVQASPLGAALAKAGASLDRAGRVVVNPDQTVPGHPEVFVIGDLAHAEDEKGALLPGVAPVAMQQGAYVARVIERRLRGETTARFRYRDKGTLATIGRAAAVAQFGSTVLSGFVAWLAWIFVHLFFLIELENRLLVMLQWAWNYVSWSRSARLITGRAAAAPRE